MPDSQPTGIDDQDRKDADDLAAPRARIIYEVVRRQGEEELDRPIGSLFWSGLAAGVTIMVSVITQGALRQKLPPDMPMRPVIADLGYSLGFIMVILGRMQLFTEQTIVTVLPNMAEPGWAKLAATARLWAVVLTANLLGAAAAAALDVHLHLTSPELTQAMIEVAAPILHKAPLDILLQGIPAGFLIASVAWLRAGTTGADFWIVFALTAAIALGDFTHVIAGSAEAFLLAFAAQTTMLHAIGAIILPALIGNVIGGTGLFALLAHAQVRQEI